MSLRADGTCSSSGGSPPPIVRISAPLSIAGEYRATPAAFGPRLASLGAVSGTVVAAQDGDGEPLDACSGITNAEEIDGNIAIVDRNSCYFVDKVANAEAAGATAVIVVNVDSDEIFEMGYGFTADPGIPAVMVGRSDGAVIRGALAEGVTATLQVASNGTDDSNRWLIGSVETGVGVLRDMWRPNCFGHPGRVNDPSYFCGAADGGGVHLNSGVPNHAYALLVDGGSFNGYVTEGIGLIKAAHIYWVAMSEYQIPASDFAHHADSLEAACADLLDAGTDLLDLVTGEPSGEVVTSADCDTLAAVIQAIELREEPPCDFQTVLQADPPRICPGGSITPSFEDDFEADPSDAWTFSHQGVEPEYNETDWEWMRRLPSGRGGSGMYAQSSYFVGDCRQDDQSGVVRMTSPPIVLPEDEDEVFLVFDHYVATEPLYDGGNVAISVNNGDFHLIEADAFAFNPYNSALDGTSENTNPLRGQAAFTGVDEGTVEGTWGQSQIRLTDLAEPGDEILVQFRFGVDGCNGVDGWYIDDVLVAHCGPCLRDANCNDGNACTVDRCDVESGTCSNSWAVAGTPCGDPTDAECSAPDTCDEHGSCLANHSPIGARCGDAASSACDSPDTCDGAGACLVNHEPTGTPCGDSSETACDGVDFCDSAGRCNENLAPLMTPCGDRSTDDCSEPDTCNGAGTCSPNHSEDGLPCSSESACLTGGFCDDGTCGGVARVNCDDGDPCTIDECDDEDGCINTPVEDPTCAGSGDDGDPDAGFDAFPDVIGADHEVNLSGGDCGCGLVEGPSPSSRGGILLGLLMGALVVVRRRRG